MRAHHLAALALALFDGLAFGLEVLDLALQICTSSPSHSSARQHVATLHSQVILCIKGGGGGVILFINGCWGVGSRMDGPFFSPSSCTILFSMSDLPCSACRALRMPNATLLSYLPRQGNARQGGVSVRRRPLVWAHHVCTGYARYVGTTRFPLRHQAETDGWRKELTGSGRQRWSCGFRRALVEAAVPSPHS